MRSRSTTAVRRVATLRPGHGPGDSRSSLQHVAALVFGAPLSVKIKPIPTAPRATPPPDQCPPAPARHYRDPSTSPSDLRVSDHQSSHNTAYRSRPYGHSAYRSTAW